MTDTLSVPETLARQPGLPANFRLVIMNWRYDTWISDEQLQSLSDADLAWFKSELALSREDLGRIFARATEIVQGLCPNDEVLLTYDSDCGNWYIDFSRPDTNGQWKVSLYRNDHFDHRSAEAV
jgi:hypothetical protein